MFHITTPDCRDIKTLDLHPQHLIPVKSNPFQNTLTQIWVASTTSSTKHPPSFNHRGDPDSFL